MFDLNFTFLGISSIMFGIFLISIIIWIYALINCITSKKETDEKIIWVLIIIFLNIIGAIIYLIFNANDTKIISKTKDGEVKRLYRSRKDSIIGGVCGGLANYFKIDPVIVRLIFVILFFIKGSGLLFYIIAWIIIPLEPKNVENKKIKTKKIEEKNKTKLKTKKTKN
ncbi:MAG: PspC domain-containing protein, partial [Nanoarchaeota archaeon]